MNVSIVDLINITLLDDQDILYVEEYVGVNDYRPRAITGASLKSSMFGVADATNDSDIYFDEGKMMMWDYGTQAYRRITLTNGTFGVE